ncbi:DUF1589 domain-containing protein [Roseobacter sp. EG26]|uniref:DUF1589 domain-containing protein n=1 Tax=Roseobacter sp. EG26 TaxID=3412477 RepID=UPI003CE57FF1
MPACSQNRSRLRRTSESWRGLHRRAKHYLTPGQRFAPQQTPQGRNSGETPQGSAVFYVPRQAFSSSRMISFLGCFLPGRPRGTTSAPRALR